MSGWWINPGIWLGKRIWCDNPWTKHVYQLFSFLFIFYSTLFLVTLKLSDILWAHVELWIYLGMPEHLMSYIRIDILLFWLSAQIQTINEINSFNLIDWELLLLPAIFKEKMLFESVFESKNGLNSWCKCKKPLKQDVCKRGVHGILGNILVSVNI